LALKKLSDRKKRLKNKKGRTDQDDKHHQGNLQVPIENRNEKGSSLAWEKLYIFDNGTSASTANSLQHKAERLRVLNGARLKILPGKY
jgi:hypothetical protein